MQSRDAIETPPPRLEAAAAVVMRDLRTACEELLERVPGRPGRAVDLERALGVSKKLAWQVFRVVKSESGAGGGGVGEIANVPSPASVRTLLAAARKHGVPARVAERAAGAFEAFHRFADSAADDRSSLVTLLTGSGSAPGEANALAARRAAYRANASIWGAKIEVMARTVIYHPRGEGGEGGDGGAQDVALILGDLGLQRMRESEPLNMLRWLKTGDIPGAGGSAPEGEGGRGDEVDHGVGLLREFCTHPLPRMVPRASVLGGVETELVIPAGRSGAVTIYSEQFRENAETAMPAYFDLRLFVTIPVGVAVLELLVPAGMGDPATARAVVYGRRPHPEHVYEERKQDLLPQRESAVYVGAPEHLPAVPGAPRHAEAVGEVIRSHGWAGTRFDVFRCRVEAPVLHTLVCVKVDAARKG